MAIVKGRSFGNVSGQIGLGEYLAIEIPANGTTYISEIIASFGMAAGDTKTSEPFAIARLVVAKVPVANFQFLINPYARISESDVILDTFIYDYDGFKSQFNQLKSDPDGAITVVLFPAYLNSDLVNVANLYASLTVLGTNTKANLGLKPI